MHDGISLAEGLQLVIEVCALASIGLGLLQRWAVANHRDRLAMWTDAGGRAADRIRGALLDLPPGADPAALRRRLLAEAARELNDEFDTTGPKIGATAAKAEKLIAAHLDAALPAPAP